MANNDKNGTAVGFLGSFALLVGALLVFILLLVNSATDDLSDDLESDRQDVQVTPTQRSAPIPQVIAVEEPVIETAPVVESIVEPDEESSKKESADKQVKQTDELIKKAVALIDGGDPETALDILEKILDDQPNNERALIEVSMIHLIDYRNSRAAVPYLERAFKVNPNNRMVLAELVGSYSEHDTVDNGINYLQSLQEKTNKESSAYISLGIGQLLLADGREEEALPHLEKAVDGMPNSPELLSSLADTHSSAGNSEKAVETYRKAIEARRASIVELAKKGKPIEQESRALLRNHIEIVREYYNQGDFDSALEAIETARNLAPDSRIIANWHRRIADKQRGAG